MKKFLPSICGFFVVILSLIYVSPPKANPQKIEAPVNQIKYPAKPLITNFSPGYQDYDTIKNQLEQWKKESPGVVSTGTYGTSTKGAKLAYIRITNHLDTTSKKKVLITACIHGNEPLACSTVMSIIGTMLNNYATDNEVTNIINTRDIYFVPVVSPDSYPHSRHVDGVDPNRNFPEPTNLRKSIKPLDDLQKWFLKEKFNAVISTHTFGRIFLIPYGDNNKLCPNNEDYTRIIEKMQALSGYRKQRACETYSRPIFGTEVDWYYRNGALSIVVEMGKHQVIPSIKDIKIELDMTYKAYLHFIKEAPLVSIKLS